MITSRKQSQIADNDNQITDIDMLDTESFYLKLLRHSPRYSAALMIKLVIRHHNLSIAESETQLTFTKKAIDH